MSTIEISKGGSSCDHEQMQEPNRQQFDDVTRPLIRHLLNHARSILPSEDLAWDAVQESLLQLWLKSQQGEHILNYAGAWLCRAVVLRSLQIRRQMGRRTRHERSAAAQQPESRPARGGASPGGGDELNQIIDLARGALPPEFRTVWELTIGEGLGYAATADRLGIPIGTVRSRLNRARALLQQVLQSATCDCLDRRTLETAVASPRPKPATTRQR